MIKTDVFSKLQDVFENVFDDVPPLTETTVADDVDGWDSLRHIQLIMATEKQFGIAFPASEVGSLKNVGDFVALIMKKLQ